MICNKFRYSYIARTVKKLKITTWDVRGLAETRHNPKPKTYNILKIPSWYRIDIAVLMETKTHRASREEEYDMDETRYNVYLYGVQEGERNHHDVALVVKAWLWNAFSGQWETINKRLISAKLSNGNKEAWIIGAYAPTNVSVAEAKDELYLHKVRTKDIYKDKSTNGEWQLLDYIAIRRTHLPRFYLTRVFSGARQVHLSADHHLVWSVVNIWDPTSGRTYKQQRQKCSVRTLHSQLDVSGLGDPQLARTLATLDLSSMTWSDPIQKLFHQARMALGFQKNKMAYWAYDFKEEVEEIVVERKAVRNSLEACRVARQKFGHVKDQWWKKRSKRVERAAEIGDSRLQYQQLEKICDPIRR